MLFKSLKVTSIRIISPGLYSLTYNSITWYCINSNVKARSVILLTFQCCSIWKCGFTLFNVFIFSMKTIYRTIASKGFWYTCPWFMAIKIIVWLARIFVQGYKNIKFALILQVDSQNHILILVTGISNPQLFNPSHFNLISTMSSSTSDT